MWASARTGFDGARGRPGKPGWPRSFLAESACPPTLQVAVKMGGRARGTGAGTGRRAPEVETIFLMTSEESFYVSSSLVKEVALMGGDVSRMVPPAVISALQSKKIR